MQIQKNLKKTELGEIPEDWEVNTLSELCNIRKPDEISSTLYIGLEHIGQGNNNLDSRGDAIDFTSNKHIFHKGDVLYGKLRPLLNKVYLAKEDGFCSTDILPLKIKGNILGEILVWNITSDRFVQYADSTSSGTKMPRTNWNDIKEFKIGIPPLKEQQKIVSILSKVDKLIQKIDQVIEQTQRLKKGLMQRLLTKGIGHREFKKEYLALGSSQQDIPFTWRVVRTNELSKVVRGSSPRPAGDRRYFGGKVPWITVGELTKNDDMYLDSVDDGLTEEGRNNSRFLEKGVVIIVNSGATLGVPKILDIAGCINDGIAAFLDLNTNIIPQFLYYVLLLWIKTVRSANQGVYQLNINTEIIGNIRVPLPPLDEQRKIVSIIYDIGLNLNHNRQLKSKLECLKKGLMQKLLTGKIRIKV